jgi:hypothetical protein
MTTLVHPLPLAPHYARHHERSARLDAAPAEVFALLDDHRRLAAHMERPSPMMAGASMKLELDARQGRGLFARIRMSGRVFGLALELDEEVVEHEVPRRKLLRTLGEPRLLVVGPYQLGFKLQPEAGATRVRMWIDFDLPARGIGRWLGRLFGGVYARWCLAQMLEPALQRFGRRAA